LKPTSGEKWQVAFLKADRYWDWVQPGGAQIGCPQDRGQVCYRVHFCLRCYFLLFSLKKKKKEKRKRRNSQGGFLSPYTP
jgi:hypothetical protein